MASLIAGGVDCDVHPAVPHLTSLLPYLNDYWRDQVTTRGMVDVVSQSYPQNSPIVARPDWRPDWRSSCFRGNVTRPHAAGESSLRSAGSRL